MRHPNKMTSFEKLKQMGVPIRTVLDVGVLAGTPELINAFPETPHLLFEPIVEWNDSIINLYEKNDIQFALHNIAVADMTGTVTLHTTSVSDSLKISHARIVDVPLSHGDHREVPADTLNNVMEKTAPAKPYLLKIDVDGAELAILSGASEMIKDCSVVVVEAHMNDFLERAAAVTKHGFVLFDVVDLAYYDDRLAQFDLVFLNSDTIKKYQLEMYKDGFDFKKWQTYSPK